MEQRRLSRHQITQLQKEELSKVLNNEAAWSKLSLGAREKLCARLPAPRTDEPPHDPAVNPLQTNLRPYVEDELRLWQADAKFGREEKKWQEEAMAASADRKAGKFDEWKASEREKNFGGQRASVIED